jgi:hypothetical protein
MEEVRAEMFRIRLWLLILALTAALLPSLSIASTENPEISPAMVRLPGHVLPALARATVVPSNPSSGSESITLTIVLRRDDQAGFESYLHDIYDPHSKNFREFLTQRQIADRFGPRRDDYDRVVSYMRARGFQILQGSKNRLTVTVRGTRSQAETAFDLRIRGYKIGARTFYANDRDPSVPIELAPRLQAVAGLSNLAKPDHGRVFLILIWVLAGVCAVVFTAAGLFVPGILTCIGAGALLSAYAACALGYFGTAAANICTLSGSSNARRPDIAVNGTGQTIGLIEFDTFQSGDVADYLNLIGSPRRWWFTMAPLRAPERAFKLCSMPQSTVARRLSATVGRTAKTRPLWQTSRASTRSFRTLLRQGSASSMAPEILAVLASTGARTRSQYRRIRLTRPLSAAAR